MKYGELVQVGDVVYCNNFPVRLMNEIGKGEEGVIYKTDSPYVCKIYKVDSLDELKYAKLTYMLNMNVKLRGICWPLALVYNNNGTFIGYIMCNAYGRELKSVLYSKSTISLSKSQWTKQELAELALTILEKIKYLHNKGVILGDINTENILVLSTAEVYFVDTDSYQINGIPCPVGTEIFTAPEIKESVYSRFLRTIGNEYFAVATLVFMIIMVGAAPYEGEKSQEVMRNISKMNFNFPLNDNKKNGYISESLRSWSNLPYFLKEAFYNTFKKGGKRSSEYSRYTTEEWITLIRKYKNEIDGYVNS